MKIKGRNSVLTTALAALALSYTGSETGRARNRQAPFKDPDFARPIQVFVCKDGTISYCARDQKKPIPEALPVFSVDTVEQARALQVTFGRAQYVRHPRIPGEPWYRWTNFSGNVDDLPSITENCAMFWIRHYAPSKA